ncbi:family 65 glycosyl hydrolase domain-containing protein [Marinilabilia salmonicolor]|uniref:family 65 glycosyl hydrolase domain-containing protein n=1 Tax=Marinilabilia salmonicolor TaxID=989 RepID=UPI0021CF01FC|nr:family 65 glycosyl hydrolase domain-containing protein [Marinilabilia salmonicolor]
MGIDVNIDGETLDLFKAADVEKFQRVLDMKSGVLSRSFDVTLNNGNKLSVKTERFLSMTRNETGVIRYSVTPEKDCKIIFSPYIDGDVENEDSNYDEKFWNILETDVDEGKASLLSQTKKSDFQVAFAMETEISGTDNFDIQTVKNETFAGNHITIKADRNQTITLIKYVGVCSSLNHKPDELTGAAKKQASEARLLGFKTLLEEQKQHWENIWNLGDIKIKGDVAAQQGIRFNIFHLNQTYTGEDERLNVGPKGFTGEKYGGTTYWDTEAYGIPFFLMTAPQKVVRNLLVYRYKHLQKAIENAEKLGFTNGAALYPMVTINGEECHNEWEITFEEIHRNGAIAFAIYNYIRHTGDIKYLSEYGLEVLVGIARFWSQRATFSHDKKKFVILGVTGPNEYENNVNNNWFTNKIAQWCLTYAREAIDIVRKNYPERFEEIAEKVNLDTSTETSVWKSVATNLHLPYSKDQEVFLQQDGYLDKEQITADELSPSVRPINQHWSWDRILRSCFIKQADTLQGIYLFEEEFDTETIRRNFAFYEPRTVHESSLSPCVHNILAARIGNLDKAYEMYLRTSRLDIDDYNREVHEGLHITSMAGTWMSIVEGFGGKRVYKDGKLRLSPIIPHQWKEYAFNIRFHEKNLEVKVTRDEVEICSHADEKISLIVYGKEISLAPGKSIKEPINVNYHA